MSKERVNHPPHYGGADNPYEVIKVIEAWELNFNLGNAVKYISRAGKKEDLIEDLEKAIWYLKREVFLNKKIDQPTIDSSTAEEIIFTPNTTVSVSETVILKSNPHLTKTNEQY